MKLADFHTHSSCSDGTLTPELLIELAGRQGLSAIALTDHDTLSGTSQAMAAAARCQIELVPGIEFSTVYGKQDIHIVGLDVDPNNTSLNDEITRLQQERRERNLKIIRRMADDGILISETSMMEEFGDTIWTRAHFARYLAAHGYVPTMADAFRTHIGEHCKYYVPRERISPFETVQIIRSTGGIPILAHPFQYHLPEPELTHLLRELKQSGLIGVEAIYSTHTPEQENLIRKLARHLDLCISGGSDFHGDNKPDIQLGCGRGNLKIPYELLTQMRTYKNTH